MSARKLLVGLALLIPLASHAASFDCGKAHTSVEKAICADPVLGSLDEQISATYHQVFNRIDTNFRPKLQASQRQWLKSRTTSADLKSVLTARLSDLQNVIITVNGITLLRLSGRYLPPYITTAVPGAAAYNKWVDQVFTDAESDNGSDAEITKCDALFDQGKTDDACEGLEQTNRSYDVDFVSPDLISVHEYLSVMSWHAAHPSNEDNHSNWWLMKPGKITLEQIFINPRYKTIIQKTVRKTFDYDLDIKATGNDVHPALNPLQWGLTTDGLNITCQGYDFSIGRGSPTLEISWADFNATVNLALLKMLAKAAPIKDSRLVMPNN